ncbi:acyl carrier protein [Goodfellowiella coeruleoviolacea]|uniref:Methoxymalonate biosynthesis acyl carrier protein n=1 Tax=Goodfellowiella coeruleoviolacea TaxID=334858 RepID=A0AAE3GJG3_9PSEU|nr:acyl carrier protein [Goodfellowiella coeruleoviolacea]MCP2168537.1 methoxymalonate biosynthesis acyl carrier protein [Goodfellowiella coeruleoviolacea]
MTIEQTAASAVTAETVASTVLGFLVERTRTTPEVDQDLFASGVVSSMFAMELIVHLEKSFGVSIVGGDLKLDNFRSVRSMTALVLRLRGDSAPAADG